LRSLNNSDALGDMQASPRRWGIPIGGWALRRLTITGSSFPERRNIRRESKEY